MWCWDFFLCTHICLIYSSIFICMLVLFPVFFCITQLILHSHRTEPHLLTNNIWKQVYFLLGNTFVCNFYKIWSTIFQAMFLLPSCPSSIDTHEDLWFILKLNPRKVSHALSEPCNWKGCKRRSLPQIGTRFYRVTASRPKNTVLSCMTVEQSSFNLTLGWLRTR